MAKMTFRAQAIALVAVLAGAAGLLAQRGQTAAAPISAVPEPPRLIVMIVVDQMRSDYINLYSHQWTRGLRRLLDTGALFPLAKYPYSITLTCAGHATISTGSYPATHGMIANDWYDRARRRNVTCTEDPAVTSIPFGGRAGVERQSLNQLRGLTLTDELRLQLKRPPTVVGLSLKARSAATLAGRPSASTYAVWLEEVQGTWATSSAYASAPWPVANTFATANPITNDSRYLWTKAMPAASYLFSDQAPGELAPNEFPHGLQGEGEKPDEDFVKKWRRSPQSDRALGSFAQHLVRELKLGLAPGTDYLGVSFSALDLVGHEYGPHSHEVQDLLFRLDATMGDLFDTLDKLVGPSRYVVGLSADHGVSLVPEQVRANGLDGGRYSNTAVRTAVNAALAGPLGEGTHATALVSDNLYFAPGVYSRILAAPGARDAVTRAILSSEGVARAYWPDELTSTAQTEDPFLRAARLSYFPGRSGDVIVMPDPYWMARSGSGTTHGSPYDYDQRVPVLFAGAGIKPGRYLVPASPADIAPTLAYLAGITVSHADGQVRTEAIR
jgi:predicted AlkP superfamily pyrophosphatase or phosphodiesterase